MAEYTKVKYYYNSELAKLIAKKIKNHDKDFDAKDFIAIISDSVEDLELKSRVNVFADALYNFLPKDYPKAASILLKILGPENTQETGMFSEGYWLMPVAYFVEKYGINHLDISMELIYEITKRHTGETTKRHLVLGLYGSKLCILAAFFDILGASGDTPCSIHNNKKTTIQNPI